MWTLDQIQTFKRVAEEENFSKVAHFFKISPTAVGKKIKQLEDSLGGQLFYRTTRRVTLTEFGKVFYERCALLLREIAKTNDLLASYKCDVQGKLKIVGSISFGERYILPNLKEFLFSYPNLIVDIELSDRIPNLETEDIDLLIGYMAGFPLQYTCRRIKEDSYVWCASPDYLKLHAAPQEPIDLEKHNYIAHSKRPSPTVLKFGDKKVYLEPKIWGNSTSILLQCCLDGIGIALFHLDTVQNYLDKNLLIEVLENYRSPKQSLYMYFKTMHYMQPKIRVFIDYLMQKMEAS